MTPKEKAKELVDRYLKIENVLDISSAIPYKLLSIESALIAVDEILIIQEYWGGINNFNYKYWQEVKQEIEKL